MFAHKKSIMRTARRMNGWIGQNKREARERARPESRFELIPAVNDWPRKTNLEAA
jgi:hypothetical protein